jgi:hypothetical protein
MGRHLAGMGDDGDGALEAEGGNGEPSVITNASTGGQDSDGSTTLNVGAGVVQETVGRCGVLTGTGVTSENNALCMKNGVGDGTLNTDGDSGAAEDDVLVMSDGVVVMCVDSDTGGLYADGGRILRTISGTICVECSEDVWATDSGGLILDVGAPNSAQELNVRSTSAHGIHATTEKRADLCDQIESRFVPQESQWRRDDDSIWRATPRQKEN